MSERYELIERIAVGGMAEIFRANKIGAAGFVKPVAVKRILPHLASDPEFVERFVAEAKISVTLAHPNIVSVFELNRFGESLYISMEYVDGPDLSSLLSAARRSARPIALGPALHIAGEILRGLEHAHAGGVIHRDVSPSNVLISRAGEIKITDFGIAKAGGADLTNNRRVMGKWPYMSPEQTRGEELDTRSDLFSAGAVLHELVCGERLFAGDNTSSIVAAIREQPIAAPSSIRPDIPPALDRAVAMLLERDVGRRAADAAAVLEAMLDVDEEISRAATSVGVAAEIERLCPRAGAEAVKPAQLLDEIINSELAHARGGGRVTVQTDPVPGRNTEGLSFVRADTGDGADIGEWQLADDTRTYTLNQTLQLFAVPQPATSLGEAETLRAQSPPELPPPQPTPPPRSRAPLIAAGALALAIAAAVAVVWSKTRDPAPRPAASADAIDRAVDAAPDRAFLSVATEPAGADVSLDGEPIGRTPIREREVTPRDKAVVAIAADGFEPINMSVDLPAGAWIRVNRTLQPTGDSGAVDVLSTPPADVYWRGKKIGRTPLRGLALPAGTHTLVLINRDQARRKVVEITVPGAALVNVEL